MQIEVQPLLIDRIKVQLTSPYLMVLPAEDDNSHVGGINKKSATENAELYAKTYPMEIKEKTRFRGRPVYWFREDKYIKQKATKVSIQPYHAFPLWIFGNPTTFQKEEYVQKGHIDGFKNALEARHENNFIHTDICDLEPRTIERENIYHLPDMNRICEGISQEVLGYIPDGYEYPHIFKNPTIDTVEINQDILVHPHDSVGVQMDLITYFQGQDGHDYLQQTGIRKVNTYENYAYSGIAIQLDYGKEGIVKIYPKTHHSLRVEAIFYGKQHIKKNLGKKTLDYLERGKRELARPLLEKIAIPKIIEEQPPPRNITPYLLEKFIPDPTEKHMAKKLHERKYLFKKEIPSQYLRGKNRLFRGLNHEGTWHYILKDIGEGTVIQYWICTRKIRFA